MLIKGKRVNIQEFDSSHLYDPDYFSWLNDKEVVRYLGREELLKGIPFEEAENYVNDLWANEYCWFLAINDSESEAFIGTAKINFLHQSGYINKVADIGIMIGNKNFWGKGLATETLRAVSRFAFDNLKARKLTAGGISNNEAVVKAFLRIGYKIDGRLRQQFIVDDLISDHVLMSCFRDELID